MSNAYIFYGKAGSGKGTQAQKLKEHLESLGRSVLYIETGELFRKFVADEKNYAADCTREIIDTGGLMPSFFPIYLWSAHLIRDYDGTQDVILDGVARRPEEAAALDSALTFFKFSKSYIFHVHISDQTAIDRLQIRGEGRADDADVSKIQSRLDWYGENVMPVLDYWRTNPNVAFAEINGEESVDGVWEQIKNKI